VKRQISISSHQSNKIDILKATKFPNEYGIPEKITIGFSTLESAEKHLDIHQYLEYELFG